MPFINLKDFTEDEAEHLINTENILHAQLETIGGEHRVIFHMTSDTRVEVSYTDPKMARKLLAYVRRLHDQVPKNIALVGQVPLSGKEDPSQ